MTRTYSLRDAGERIGVYVPEPEPASVGVMDMLAAMGLLLGAAVIAAGFLWGFFALLFTVMGAKA